MLFTQHSPVVSLYRRVLRLGRLFKQNSLQKRIAYNAREVISLYMNADNGTIDRLIKQAHQDLDVWQTLLTKSDPKLLSQLLQSFHSPDIAVNQQL